MVLYVQQYCRYIQWRVVFIAEGARAPPVFLEKKYSRKIHNSIHMAYYMYFMKIKKSINSYLNWYLNTFNTPLTVLSNVHYRSYYQNENQGTL